MDGVLFNWTAGVIPYSVVSISGRIRVGDQLLAANGKSLLGVSNDQ